MRYDTPTQQGRERERGAALITMLLVATLVLVAGGALIISTATSATNAIDSTAEKQSYYAAEAGLQLAVNALRGNMAPDGAVAGGTRMSFRAAVTPNLSNGDGRSGGNNQQCGTADAAAGRCRLAGWLPYPDKASSDSNIAVGNSAFRVAVYDPDNSHNVIFSTTGRFQLRGGLPIAASVQDGGRTLLVGTAPLQTRIEFVGRTNVSLNNAVNATATDFGTFRITNPAGTPVAIPAGLMLGTFQLVITQAGPWPAEATFQSRVLGTAAGCPGQVLAFAFNQASQQADGTTFLQTALNGSRQLLLPCALGAATSTLQVQGNVTSPAPKRLVVRSVGFGPKFAQKRLEMLVERSNFAGDFPATITLRGSDTCPPNSTVDTGSSGAKEYLGRDKDDAAAPPLPPFAVTGCDVAAMEDGIKKHDTVGGGGGDPEIGILGNGTTTAATTVPPLPVDMPSYLRDPDAARNYLQELKDMARTDKRYFKPAAGSAYTVTNADGTTANYGFTFVDGDCNLDTTSPAAGLLVCTGNLSMSGNPSFDGVVLVLGAGSVNRDGGGGGVINGGMVVANFEPWNEVNGRPVPFTDGLPHPFGAVSFNTNGGGNSTMQFSSTAIQNAMGMLGGPRVAGILEF